MDTTDSLSFKWPLAKQIFRALFLLPLGLFLVVMCPVAVIDMARREPILAAVGMALFGMLPLMAAGIVMLYFAVCTDRKLTVSRHEIRVRRWVGGNRTVDISSLAAIVLYGRSARLVFLPRVGPPLLSVDVDDFPDGMPAAIEELVRLKIDRLGEVDKDELRAKYPRNAKEADERLREDHWMTAESYEVENEWRGRAWEW